MAAFPDTLDVLVVGAGPSGLVSLKYLIEYGPSLGIVSREAIEDGTGVLGVEMEAEIGGTFRYDLSPLTLSSLWPSRGLTGKGTEATTTPS